MCFKNPQLHSDRDNNTLKKKKKNEFLRKAVYEDKTILMSSFEVLTQQNGRNTYVLRPLCCVKISTDNI